MLLRYMRSTFLFWFAGIFTAVGLVIVVGVLAMNSKEARITREL